MDIGTLAVKETDWDDIVQNPWNWKNGAPDAVKSIRVTYMNDTEQILNVVGMNKERQELYAYYGDNIPGLEEKDIRRFIIVKFRFIGEYEEVPKIG